VLEPAYRRVRDDPNRSYPLHIEASWERDPGLPDLDPVQVKAAEVRRKAEEAARAASVQRRARVRAFTLCTVFGQLVRKDGGWHWVLSGSTGALGSSRLQAFDALQQLDPTLRSLLEQNAEEAFGQQAGDLRTRAALTETVSAHLAALTSAYAAAVASLDEAEKHFLGEERAVVEGLLARNPLPPPRG
jgi:hypothetical protein